MAPDRRNEPDWSSLASFLTWRLFLLLWPGFCAAEASPLLPACSWATEALFFARRLSGGLLETWGTLQSRLRWILTSRDGAHLWESRRPRWVLSGCLGVILGGTLVPFWQTASDFDLAQLILMGGAGDSGSGWAGLRVGQGQELGY